MTIQKKLSYDLSVDYSYLSFTSFWRKTISGFLKRYPLSVLGIAAALTSSSFVIALRLSVSSQIVTASVLLASFLFSKSVTRGLFAVIAGVALATTIGSLQFPNKSFDSPNVVILIACAGTTLVVILMRRFLFPVKTETYFLELITSLPLFVTSILLRPITHASSSILMANLGPEDNASWIHAASGFLRYNATATEVSNTHNGADGFLSTLLSFFTTVSKWGSEINEIQLVLISVFNSYIFCILIASLFTVSACAHLFSNIIKHKLANNQAELGLFGLLGIPTTIVLGVLMSTYGHLSLVVAIMIIWITFWMLCEFSDSNLKYPHNKKSKIFQILSQLAIVLMIGSTWFPLIPISYILIISIVSRSVYREFRTRFETNLGSDSHTISIRSVTVRALFFILVLSFALATFRLLQFPIGYSAAELINASGGTYTITGLVLGLSLMGLLFSANSDKTLSPQSIFPILLIMQLIAVWILSLPANPSNPGYSIQKFAVLIAAIGVPLTTSLITGHLLTLSRNPIFLISVPIVVTISILQMSFGINSFPRSGVMEVSRSGVANYQEDLIKLASENKNSQILCLSNSTDSNFSAYICSRFASAIQFKERGDGDLARRWRSQILELAVEPQLLTGEKNFGVSEAIKDYVDSGGVLVINLIPGPLSDIQTQTERQWIKELPWSEIKTYWRNS